MADTEMPDLDTLEREAHAGAASPDAVISLIARVRELEALGREALDRWKIHYECYVDYTEEEGKRIEQLRDVLLRKTSPTPAIPTEPSPRR